MKQTGAALARIRRYPVKGFGGQDLETARLSPGQGVPFDRRLGVVSGNRPEKPVAGGWVPSRTFVQNTVFDDLLKIACRFDGDRVRLVRSEGGSLDIRLGDAASLEAANASIAGWFENGPHAPIALAEQKPDCGFWDYTDSNLSIINSESVAALEASAGRTLDPVRFRGNLYVDGVAAWQEFSWVGGTLRIGETVLEIIRPILRCAATSVDPSNGERDFNLPGFMQQQFGHCFCGVYARVISGGDIHSGDPIQFKSGSVATVGPQPENAPPRNRWPRLETLTSVSAGGASKPMLAWPSFLHSDGEHHSAEIKLRLHNLPSRTPSWVSITARPLRSNTQPGWVLAIESGVDAKTVRTLVADKMPILVTGPF